MVYWDYGSPRLEYTEKRGNKMTIDEAIAMLEAILRDREDYRDGMGNDAIKLSIEALKRFQEGRPKCFISTVLLLPGETKD